MNIAKIIPFSKLPEKAKEMAISYGIKPDNAPRYSIWRPNGSSTSTVMETDIQGKTWFLTIHDDNLAYVVAAFLEHHGAPVFRSAQKHKFYNEEMERQLRGGLTSIAARDEALRLVDASIADIAALE